MVSGLNFCYLASRSSEFVVGDVLRCGQRPAQGKAVMRNHSAIQKSSEVLERGRAVPCPRRLQPTPAGRTLVHRAMYIATGEGSFTFLLSSDTE